MTYRFIIHPGEANQQVHLHLFLGVKKIISTFHLV